MATGISDRLKSIQPAAQAGAPGCDSVDNDPGPLAQEGGLLRACGSFSERQDTPIDVRLLSQAVIELNILRKNTVLYTSSHAGVASNLDRAHDTLRKINALCPRLTVGVAKDCLLFGSDLLDPKNPVNREFALVLSRRAIASVTFLEGLRKEEILDFINILTTSPQQIIESGGVPLMLGKFGVTGVQVQGIDYGTFHLTEEEKIVRTKSQRDLQSTSDLWRDFVTHLLSGQLSGNGQGASVTSLGGIDPTEMAAFLKEHRFGLQHPMESYDQFIAKCLPATSGHQPDNKFNSLLRNLEPQLKRQFLSVALDSLAQGREQVVEGFEDDIVLEMLQQASDEGREISPGLLALVQKLSLAESDSPEISPGEKAPPLILPVSETEYRANIEKLFDRECYEDYVDASYRSMLHKSSGKNPPGFCGREPQSREGYTEGPKRPQTDCEDSPAGRDWAGGVQKSFLDSRIIDMVLAFMDQEIDREDYEDFSAKLMGEVPSLLESGNFDLLIDILKVLERHSREKPEDICELALEHLGAFCGAEILSKAVDAFKRRTGADMEKPFAFLSALGSACIPGLLEIYANDDSLSENEKITGLLLKFREAALGKAYEKLPDSDPSTIKNLLGFIRKSGGAESIPHARPFLTHEDFPVRMAALAVLLEFKDPEGVFFLRKALQSKMPEETLWAIHLCGSYGVKGVADDLLRLSMTRFFRHSYYEREEAIVKALGQIGDPRALPMLEKIARSSWSLSPSKLRHLKLVVFESLGGYPRDSIGALLRLGERSDDRVLMLIARGFAGRGA
ncbi:MAG: hypothetical protein ABSF52_23040 [Syntrophobacteraceae bacterium]